MVSSLGSTNSSAGTATSVAPGNGPQIAALEKQLTQFQKQLSSAQQNAITPVGQEQIQILAQEITTIEVQIAQLSVSQNASSDTINGVVAQNAGTITAGASAHVILSARSTSAPARTAPPVNQSASTTVSPRPELGNVINVTA